MKHLTILTASALALIFSVAQSEARNVEPRRISTMFDSTKGIEPSVTFILPDGKKIPVRITAPNTRISISPEYTFSLGDHEIKFIIKSQYAMPDGKAKQQEGTCTVNIKDTDLKEHNQGVRLSFVEKASPKSEAPPWYECQVILSHPK